MGLLSTYFLGFIFLVVVLVVTTQVFNFRGKRKIPLRDFKEISDSTIIDQAIRQAGVLTPTSLSHGCKVPVSVAAARLEELHQQGVFLVDVQDTGTMQYRLADQTLLPRPEHIGK